jgi:hypothetical protein
MEISVPQSGGTDFKKQPSGGLEPIPEQSYKEIEICEIQLFYSTQLDILTKLGFAFLLITFALYIFGILGNFVPRQFLPELWGQSLQGYLGLTKSPTGWRWLWELHHGDFLNLLPIALLAGITIICTITVTFRFFRNREPFQGIIAIMEVLVLLVAASGFLKVGGR